MILKKFVVGLLETNCYIFGDGGSKEIVLIDPGADPGVIKTFIKKNNLELKYVINTHGHGDHIAANDDFKTDVLIHRLDKDFLVKPSLNLSAAFGVSIKSSPAARLLEDGDVIKAGKLELEVIHTPGHTPGGICLKYDNMVFSGDTLFFEGVGRTDIPYASWADLEASIKNRLMALPDDCKVYPGHGQETTIGNERRYNPFILDNK